VWQSTQRPAATGAWTTAPAVAGFAIAPWQLAHSRAPAALRLALPGGFATAWHFVQSAGTNPG
jgi:hypothetical protein